MAKSPPRLLCSTSSKGCETGRPRAPVRSKSCRHLRRAKAPLQSGKRPRPWASWLARRTSPSRIGESAARGEHVTVGARHRRPGARPDRGFDKPAAESLGRIVLITQASWTTAEIADAYHGQAHIETGSLTSGTASSGPPPSSSTGSTRSSTCTSSLHAWLPRVPFFRARPAHAPCARMEIRRVTVARRSSVRQLERIEPNLAPSLCR